MIEVNNLTFSYHKHQNAISDLNFKIKKGEIFGLLGPSGAGKSTTQKIIIGILKDYQGSVKVMGKEISEINQDFYEHIGACFELPNLYEKFTALENLNYFKGMYQSQKKNPLDLLKMVGLLEYKDKRISEFSKGMKMRLNFCRAFINDPDILFFDEPTTGLDPVNARNIKEIILKQKELGKTIFLTTHNMTVADELCDKVAFIVDGHIKLIDAPRKLKKEMGERKIQVEYIDKQNILKKTFNLKNIGFNEEYQKLLKTKEIERMSTLEASLETIFIQVTGKALCD